MVTAKDIPAEIRWEIAANSGTAMSVALDRAFRQAFGDKIDDITIQIWAEGGKQSKAIANALGLPARNAREVDEALGIVSTIILGPGFEGEYIESNDDRVRFKVTRCPMLNAHMQIDYPPTTETPKGCQAFCQNLVENLNQGYTLNYSKRMCTGDPYCEYSVGKR
jgi:hypothetical protein